MTQIQKNVRNMKKTDNFDRIKVSIASPEQIRSWSYGEVKKPDTVNYRTFKPEKAGLFCAKIFGPVKDYECLCGKYKRIKYKGVICENCGVEITVSKVRRERMGHIELACPVAHIWFLKSLPSKISTLLDIPVKKLEKVLYFDNYIIIEPGLTPLKQFDLITDEEYFDYTDQYGEESFRANIGAQAIKELLSQVNLEQERDNLREELINTKSEQSRKKIIKRLKIVEAFSESGVNPQWMIMDVLPVLPPELRPLVPLDGGRFASSDLNDLYRRVINRNSRLKRLMDLKAPEIIVRNEKRMLQEAVDSLFDNSRKSNPVMNNRRPLKSLSDMLKGKQGRFRQNLLGKRVDYSGRSVIVSGPELKLHQCGLPKKMALELFKPFIFSKLEQHGYANTIKSAKKLVEREEPVVWEVLEDIIKEHPVLLNRAPTLHRLGMQAFEPILIEGKAIQLHPLVCSGFNADFDGDTMSVHVPLSLEAQLEARVLMLSTNNILKPSSGKPVITPDQDIVLGIYFLTSEKPGAKGEGMAFSSVDEIELAIEAGKLDIQAKIKAKHSFTDENGNTVSKIYDTTAGRMILSKVIPSHKDIPFETINKKLIKKDISKLVGTIHHFCGQKATVIFCDRIMQAGFKYSTKSGVSIGKSDIKIPAEKEALINSAQTEINQIDKQYQEGLITRQEKYNKTVDCWTKCSEDIKDKLIDKISELNDENVENSIYMMSNSGARGSETQIRQLGAMRGLMAKPSGEIIATPIISNFKEGLSVAEFFNSTHGSRKGLADTALKTATAGYLTRRLVDVAQDAIIVMEDCGTKKSITTTAVVNGSNVIESLGDRVLGRVAAEDIINPENKEILVKEGNEIIETDIPKITDAGLEAIKIRSVLTCECQTGICAKCYGRDLSKGQIVNVGEAVGIIAGQSIGEPGTQLTLRTFHVGGTAQKGAQESTIETPFNAKAKLENCKTVVNSEKETIVMSRNAEVVLFDKSGKEISRQRIPYGSKLFIKSDTDVEKGLKIAEWNPYIKPLINEIEGTAIFSDLIDNISLQEVVDDTTGISSKIVSDWRSNSKGQTIKPEILITDGKGEIKKNSSGIDTKYIMSIGSIILVENGDTVKPGDIISYIPVEDSKTKDITGGLPRVEELLEARNPSDMAIIAKKDGIVMFKDDLRSKYRLEIQPEDGSDPIEYSIAKGTHINVQNGDFIRRGDKITDGSISPHDILEILGIEELAKYLVQEVQEVYRLQGVEINDKHIETIIKQMLKKKEVVQPNSTTFLTGQVVGVEELKKENEKAIKAGGKPAKVNDILLGITKASLQTDSFISSASFQETTKVITEAAIEGKEDILKALKENVIVGRLIPAGTGSYMNEIHKIAREKDLEIEKQMVKNSVEEEIKTTALPSID